MRPTNEQPAKTKMNRLKSAWTKKAVVKRFVIIFFQEVVSNSFNSFQQDCGEKAEVFLYTNIEK